jgi:hypothetical protein
MIVKKCAGGKVSLDKIRQVIKAMGIIGNPFHTSITLKDAKRHLKVADEEYCLLKVNAPMMQQDFLWDRMQDETLSDKARKHAKQSAG